MAARLALLLMLSQMVLAAIPENLSWVIVIGMMILRWIFASRYQTWPFHKFSSPLKNIRVRAAICFLSLFCGKRAMSWASFSHSRRVTGKAIALARSSLIATLASTGTLCFWKVSHGTVEHYATRSLALCG